MYLQLGLGVLDVPHELGMLLLETQRLDVIIVKLDLEGIGLLLRPALQPFFFSCTLELLD